MNMLVLPEAENVEKLHEIGWFSAGDLHFARLCAEGSSGSSSTLTLVAASVSRALGQGHPCVPLTDLAGATVFDADEAPRFVMPVFAEIQASLAKATCVTHVAVTQMVRSKTESGSSRLNSVVPAGPISTPLVLDDAGRLYVTRYFEHEQILADRLALFLQKRELHAGELEWIERRLDHYFPQSLPSTENLQRSAAEAALRQRFCVISGGPGTGKTSTVVKILSLLMEQAESRGQTLPVVQLMAPTGKAAARMMEAILQGAASLNLPEKIRAAISTQASTIHRALGVLPHNSTRFSRGKTLRLRADLVLVDEASMVDLSLMRHLLDALRDDAQLILLGDRHQLASVDAGSVLSELCSALSKPNSSFSAPGSATGMVELKKSFRFSEDSGIAALAAAIREGKGEASVEILRSGRQDLSFGGALDVDGGPSQSRALRRLIVEHYGAALSLKEPAAVLEVMNRFRVLCAHRTGSLGIEGMNELIREWLCSAALLPASSRRAGILRGSEPLQGAGAGSGDFYRGRLILVTENDYGVGLRNGDVGLAWPDHQGRIQVLFTHESGTLRALSPAQLPAHETAFATTIHKSQGSEHDVVVVILPSEQSPLLTRELVYTAVTRARKQAHVFGSEQALAVAASRTVTRHSGLGDACRARLSASRLE